MATTFLYLGIAAAIAAMIVLGVGLRQMVRERKSLTSGQYSLFLLLCLAGTGCFSFTEGWTNPLEDHGATSDRGLSEKKVRRWRHGASGHNDCPGVVVASRLSHRPRPAEFAGSDTAA